MELSAFRAFNRLGYTSSCYSGDLISKVKGYLEDSKK